MPANLDAALAYAQQGLPVFPLWPVRAGQCACGVTDCKNAGKHPIATLAPQGLKNATVDPTVITTWWTRWPDANIAGRLGNGVAVVLDVDPRHGGNESLAELIAENGSLPKGPVTLTGGGGKHYWFKHPGGVAPIAHGFRPGLDFQGDNTYVLLPPSSHRSGNEYRWETPLGTVPLPMVPAWLFSAADRPTRSTKRFEAGADGRIPHGQHHDFIVQTAASFASRIAGITEPVLMRQVTGALRESIDDVDAHAQEIDQAVRSAMGKYARPAPPVQPAPPPAASPAPGSPPTASQFPPNLFVQTKNGLRESLPGFAGWFRSTDDFVVPIERGTFSTPSKFELLRYESGYYNGKARSMIRGRVEDAFRSQGLASVDSFREEVVKSVAGTSEFHRSRESFNPPESLCLKTGILDTVTLAVAPHSPKVVFTWQLPVEYDPTATCPRFEQFLQEVMPDTLDGKGQQRRELLIDLLGYCLWRRNPFQQFFVFVGDGANGKTTYAKVIQMLLGPDAVSDLSLQQVSASRFTPAELDGKLVNLCDDLPYDKPLTATGTLKVLTGEGTLVVERKGQHPFPMRFDGKMISMANRTPRTEDDSYAFWRRVTLFKFEQTFPVGDPRRDPLLEDKLRAELPGILNLALRGLGRVRARLEFDPNRVLDPAKEEWHKRADPVRSELLEAFEERPGAFTSNDEIREYHIRRAEAEGRTPLNDRALGQVVTRTFPSSRSGKPRKGGPHGRIGIARKTVTPELRDPNTGTRLDDLDLAPETPGNAKVPGYDVSRQQEPSGTPETPDLSTPHKETENHSGNAGYEPSGVSGVHGVFVDVRKSTDSGGSEGASELAQPDLSEDEIANAYMDMTDVISTLGGRVFGREDVRVPLVRLGHTERAINAALGRICGGGILKRLGDDQWQLKVENSGQGS
jgi:putative DNA primase/helicase